MDLDIFDLNISSDDYDFGDNESVFSESSLDLFDGGIYIYFKQK